MCTNQNNESSRATRSISWKLGLGILFLPVLFSWFTLRKGYSNFARVLAAAWLGIWLVFYFSEPTPTPVSQTATKITQSSEGTVNKAPTVEKTFLDLSCAEFSRAFGSLSTLSDLKKDEMFKELKGHYVKWTGEVGEVSTSLFGGISVQILCLDSTLIADASISFDETYKDKLLNYQKGQKIIFEARLDRWGALLPHSLSEGRLVQ